MNSENDAFQKEIQDQIEGAGLLSLFSRKNSKPDLPIFIHCGLVEIQEIFQLIQQNAICFLFSVDELDHYQIEKIHKFSLENNSLIIYADDLLYHPIINSIKLPQHKNNVICFEQNGFQKAFSKQDLFKILQLSLSIIKSPLKSFNTKVFLSEDHSIQFFLLTMVFNDTSITTYKWTNSSRKKFFNIELENNNLAYQLDLLSFNGEKIERSGIDVIYTRLYPKSRNALKNCLFYAYQNKETMLFKTRFKYVVQTSELISKIEHQLRNDVPNFTHL